MKEIHLTIQLRNNRLRERRVSRGLTASALCEKAAICPAEYSRLERMVASPFSGRDKHKWRKAAIKLAAFYGCEPAELFPAGALIVEKPNVEHTFDAVEAIAFLSEHSQKALLPQDEIIDGESLSGAVRESMSTLGPREMDVVSRRFGLDGNGGETIASIAASLGLCVERIRQIEGSALRKLRNPRHARLLKEFVP